ncbi:hypothetical protein EXU85_32670 [Spirosoma sp. KCTC 42546]|uniref:hypothetical protein n=1 Tax=Spirosoma sp. KCTC 42546 TaxID=2520506 RepID=UPI001159E69E|nr:hypothetical protein [Spirosoma sp. KCTC 42546]QDK83102.1 hypothetical protein EXU85_32670 [Spirosoma sp. KCTC 42546]
MHFSLRLFSLLIGLLFLSFQQPGSSIRLRSESLPFTPKEFYIATVTDQRTEGGPIARLALVPNQPVYPVDLERGVAASFQQFINQGLKQNKKLRPIAMRIRQCRVSETAKGTRVTGQFTFAVTFELLGKDDAGTETSTQLTDYRGSANYTRPIDQTSVIEQTIRQALVSSLKTLNEYMNRESGRNEKLARSLKINFIDDTRITDDDTVHYNPTRKLTWADFQAAPRKGSHYAAEVFTSFSYEGKSTVKDGVIILNLNAKAYMLKTSSWGRSDARTAYALNHEQRHFDITKIIVERFKRRLHPDSLTLEDYNSIAQYQFIESYRELNRMQTQYDDETNHSINQAAQERWNQKIDEELRTFGIIK